MTSDLATWLGEKIAQDRDLYELAAKRPRSNKPTLQGMLNRVEAHAAILELHEHRRPFPVHAADEIGCVVCHVSEIDGDINTSPNGWCATIRALALAFQNREGYREEWRP